MSFNSFVFKEEKKTRLFLVPSFPLPFSLRVSNDRALSLPSTSNLEKQIKTHRTRRNRTPGSKANMFSFTGPRGLLVRGVLDEGEALRARVGGGLRGATVVVGTPDMLLAACPTPSRSQEEELQREREKGELDIFPLGSTAVAIAVDEADACLDLHGDSLSKFLLAAEAAAVLNDTPRPDIVLVGASAVSGGAFKAGVEGGWLRGDATFVVGAGMDPSTSSRSSPPSSSSSSSSPAALLPRIPSSIRHRVCAVPEREDALPALARLLRADAAAAGPDAPAPRTIAFASDEQAAKVAAKALRASLWGVHTLAVLLPSGREPTRAAHAFRDGRASLLLATPAAARGLDLPAVAAVYCLGPPGGGAADYLHRAGRAGRLGVSFVLGACVRWGLSLPGGGDDPPRNPAEKLTLSFLKKKNILRKKNTVEQRHRQGQGRRDQRRCCRWSGRKSSERGRGGPRGRAGERRGPGAARRPLWKGFGPGRGGRGGGGQGRRGRRSDGGGGRRKEQRRRGPAEGARGHFLDARGPGARGDEGGRARRRESGRRGRRK